MTEQEFKDLRPGDMVRGRVWGVTFIVTANYGTRVTAVQSADLTNPPEWDLVSKAAAIEAAD